MILFLLAFSAQAAEPVMTTAEDGTVILNVEVPASIASVREALADPVTVGKYAPDVISIDATPKGPCSLITASSPGLMKPINYQTLRCPTATGWRYDLVSSDAIESLHSEWRLESVSPEVTRVTYSVNTVINLGVPQSMVRKGVEHSAKDTLASLIKAIKPS